MAPESHLVRRKEGKRRGKERDISQIDHCCRDLDDSVIDAVSTSSKSCSKLSSTTSRASWIIDASLSREITGRGAVETRCPSGLVIIMCRVFIIGGTPDLRPLHSGAVGGERLQSDMVEF